MATLNSPVELPTGRHSFVEFPMTANIQDPTSWDALPNEGTLTRGNSKVTAARTSSRQSSRDQQSVRTKASPAVEFPPQELEAQPLSYFPPRQSSAQATWSESSSRKNTQDTRSEVRHTAQTSDDYTSSTTSASTAGTSSLPDHQVYSLPTSAVSPKEENIPSPVLSSNRSTTNSVKKSTVPTSKYKKKPPPSLRSSIKRKSEVETPVDSPMSSYTQVLQSPTSDELQVPMPSELSATARSPTGPSPPPEARLVQAPLQHTKSTASVRKARALHSHPSMPTLRPSDVASSLQISQPSPNLSATKLRKSIDAARNRPSIYDLQEPTPAPNTPLPDLPPGVQPLSRPASRDVLSQPTPPPDVHVRPGTSSSAVAPTLRRQDTSPQAHSEMANYMASSSKIIFRRFHDVHIRLLLTLQDDISALERELAEIENAQNSIDVDREVRRVRVLSELRKLLAEYDHLFANWNLMQASKADAKTREELEQYLKRPGTNSGATISNSAVDDLLWLQVHNNDLSCVDLNAKKDQVKVTQSEIQMSRGEADTPQETTTVRTAAAVVESGPGGKGTAPLIVDGGGYSGGFASLFASCAGKRK